MVVSSRSDMVDLRKKSSCFISLCCITTEYWTVILKLLPHNFSHSWRESHIDYTFPIITDIFPPWWDFVMVRICRQAMMVMVMMMSLDMLLCKLNR